MAAACLHENDQHFTQARTTPWLQNPLYPQAGRIGLNDFTEHILHHGKFPPDFDSSNVDQCVHRLLPFLQRDPRISDFDWEYNPAVYAAGWKKDES